MKILQKNKKHFLLFLTFEIGHRVNVNLRIILCNILCIDVLKIEVRAQSEVKQIANELNAI